MEKFKAVEKAMKTKAYSKEGLSAAAKLDPKEQAKAEASEFLSGVVDELEQQIETLEAEGEAIQATMKKGKGHSAKADRIAEIERIIERHKWHQGKLELIRRSLENGGVETEQVTDLEESIKYYVSDGMNDDFMEDEGIYDELNLEEEEDAFGMNVDGDKGSSQDTQSIQDDVAETESRAPAAPVPSAKQRAPSENASSSSGRRPSTQLKSPLPTLATVHSPLAPITNGPTPVSGMKPASVPTRPAGEGLKYASAAAAAAASDKNNVGIAPLPPPPSANPGGASISPVPAAQTQQARTSTTNSPSTAPIQPATQEKASNPIPPSAPAVSTPAPAAPVASSSSKAETLKGGSRGKAQAQTSAPEPAESSKAHTNGVSNGIKPIEEEEEESIYHLPESLKDLVSSFESIKARPAPSLSSPITQRLQIASEASKPDLRDTEVPPAYHPDVRYHSHTQFPQEPLPIFENPSLYARIDPDTLFYVFYYKQGSYQQYLAAKALKDQSWRFHKQYQTWFQRHEEPKAITEEFEQGTYRFFDYESTW